MAARITYLERYLAGEYEPVWAELVALGGRVCEEPLYTEARAVARETMRRVRHNVELLIPRLRALGYRFGEGLFPDAPLDPEVVPGPPHAPPEADAPARVDELEGLVGAIPLSVRAFYEVVGAVNLAGMHPDWPRACNLDPLFVYPLHVQIDMCGDWLARKAAAGQNAGWAAFPVMLTMAPDEDSKYGVEGDVYEMVVPTAAMDGMLLGERHQTTFVNYLRTCFQWAGFPGLDQLAVAPVWASALLALARDLQPI